MIQLFKHIKSICKLHNDKLTKLTTRIIIAILLHQSIILLVFLNYKLFSDDPILLGYKN